LPDSSPVQKRKRHKLLLYRYQQNNLLTVTLYLLDLTSYWHPACTAYFLQLQELKYKHTKFKKVITSVKKIMRKKTHCMVRTAALTVIQLQFMSKSL